MTVLAIELNDSGILASSASLTGEPQPGCALYDDQHVKTGVDAQRAAKLSPRQVEWAYWHRLSVDPLGRTSPLASTYADLAHAQIAKIYEPYRKTVERVLIGVPSSFSSRQLGLLLGICQRAEIPVTGLADVSVAAVTHPVPGRRMLHVDATNHCVLITELVVDSGLHRAEVVRIDNVGLLDFSARWASTLGDVFVKQTRFDPLHSARAEQFLYSQLPTAIDEWHAGAETVELTSEDQQHTIKAETSELSAAVAGLYQPMVNAIQTQTDAHSVTTVMLSHRVASLPGFEALIASHDGVRVVALDQHAVTRALLQNAAQFESAPGQFALTKSKAWQETPSVVQNKKTEAVSGSPRDVASHVLIDDVAYRLNEEPFVIGTAPVNHQHSYQVTGVVKGVSRQHCSLARRSGQVVLDDMSTYGTHVNGKRASQSQPLRVGDRVSLGNPGIELRLIREALEHG